MKHSKYWLLLVVLLTTVLVGGSALATPAARDTSKAEAKIEPLVLTEMSEAGSTDFFVWMTEKADLSPAYALATKEARGRFVFETLTTTAERTQKDLRAYLDSQDAAYKPFYIANKILVQGGNQELVLDVAARADVARITANHTFQLQEPFINPNPPESTAVIEPNITWVGAPDVWAMGYKGEGTILAGNDTGLDWDHPALINNYRGWDGSSVDHNYNWWDATGTYPTPGDGHGHGTHTTGTMVGDDGATHQIGMAPAAQTIHCKNMSDFGSGTDSSFTECFEWDLAPWDLTGANPDPDMAPDAVNNSWGYFAGNQPQFQDEIAALQAAGVAVEVSAGNEGPGCGSLRSPGDYLDVITTGSVQHLAVYPGTITSFSSRGPSDLAPNSEFFPDVMAPGENINSSLPGGGYSGPTWSGTSMSGPHVVGLIGLMWSASPGIHGDVVQAFDIIKDTAAPLTGQNGSNCGGDYTTGPNHDWGWGTIDAVAAVNEAINRGGPNFTLSASPEDVSICAPATANYAVDLGQILGYSFSVNLSVTGHPAGTTANFTPSAVVPPGTSNLTIGNTAAGAWGDYTLTITGTGTDPEVKTHSDTVDLSLRTAAPGSVTLIAPANGATDVLTAPTYQWNAAVQGVSYQLQVATDPAFTNVVYTATVEETTHTATTNLEPETLYYWRVRSVNACGNGQFSATWSFTTRAIPPILLVDDDDNAPDVRIAYTQALNSMTLSYDIWDTENSDNEPTAVDLGPYRFVLWFTGVEYGGAAGPGSAGEDALGAWLDGGGKCLFLSSQDYYYDRGLTDFMETHLGLASATSDISQTEVQGHGPFGGLGRYTLDYPFTNFSDRFRPDATAQVAFRGDQGRAAIAKQTASYETTFLGFPWEAIPTAADRAEVLQRFLTPCGG